MNALLLVAALVAQPVPPAPGRQLLPAVVDGRSVQVWGWPVRYPNGQFAVGYFPHENPQLRGDAAPASGATPNPKEHGVSLPPPAAMAGEVMGSNDREFSAGVAAEIEGGMDPVGQLLKRRKQRRECGPDGQPCPEPDGYPDPSPAPEPAPARFPPLAVALVVLVPLALLVVLIAAAAVLYFLLRTPHPPRSPHVVA